MVIKMNKVILFAFFLFMVSVPVQAEEKVAKFSAATKEVANEVMLNIYKDILKAKDKYPELQGFGENSLYENKYGIYAIVYKDNVDPKLLKKGTSPFELGLTIDKIDDVTFAKKPNNFNFAFPMLGLKFSGYQTKRMLRTQYDMMPLVNKNGNLLSDYQQKFMPLRLTVRTMKDSYKVREDIEFEVVLKNVSNRHMVVKSLGMDTLFFVFGDMTWGTSPNSDDRGGEDVVLKSGESLSLKFKGESFPKPKDIEIYCAYRMSIKGVNPSDTLRVKVVEDQ